MDNEILTTEVVESEETQEVAEPVEESEETMEVAEPSKARTEADAKFAQMRRENEALKKQAKTYEDTLGLFFDGDDKVAQAKAHYYGKDLNEVKAEMANDEEKEYLTGRVAELEKELLDNRIKTSMANDLAEIQKIDPTVKSLDELGETYFSLIETGRVDCKTAYYAAMAHKEHTSVSTPKAIGKLDEAPVEKDYYTREEVENMSDSEVKKNYDKIRASMSKW